MSATPKEVWSRLYEGTYSIEEVAKEAGVSLAEARHAMNVLYIGAMESGRATPRWSKERGAHLYQIPLHVAKGPWQARDPNWAGHARAAAYAKERGGK